MNIKTELKELVKDTKMSSFFDKNSKVSLVEQESNALPAIPTEYKHGQLFKHIDGGLYQFDRIIYSSEDKSIKVVYDHLWPFEQFGWERPIAEFQKNFHLTTNEVVLEAMKKDKVLAQKEVTEHKKNRKNKVA